MAHCVRETDAAIDESLCIEPCLIQGPAHACAQLWADDPDAFLKSKYLTYCDPDDAVNNDTDCELGQNDSIDGGDESPCPTECPEPHLCDETPDEVCKLFIKKSADPELANCGEDPTEGEAPNLAAICGQAIIVDESDLELHCWRDPGDPHGNAPCVVGSGELSPALCETLCLSQEAVLQPGADECECPSPFPEPYAGYTQLSEAYCTAIYPTADSESTSTWSCDPANDAYRAWGGNCSYPRCEATIDLLALDHTHVDGTYYASTTSTGVDYTVTDLAITLLEAAHGSWDISTAELSFAPYAFHGLVHLQDIFVAPSSSGPRRYSFFAGGAGALSTTSTSPLTLQLESRVAGGTLTVDIH